MLGLLLARAGVDVLVLEKHGDFLRDFRVDTIHPSTLEVMHELGLLPELLRLPHQEAREISAQIGDLNLPVAEFTHLPTRCQFLAFMPQWDFLNFLAEHAARYPRFRLRMRAEVTALIERLRADHRRPRETRDNSRCARISSSAPMAVIRGPGRRRVSKSASSERRWMCCGSGSPGEKPIPRRRWAASIPADYWS